MNILRAGFFSAILMLFCLVGNSYAVNLTLNVTGGVGGNVIGPAGLDCPGGGVCGPEDVGLDGTIINLSATPDSGWTFANWTGNVTGFVVDVNDSNPQFDIGSTDRLVTANFSKINYDLTTSMVGNGTVTASTTYTYDQGLAVVASPDTGWQFDGWTGAGTGNLVDQTVASTSIKNPTTSNTDVVANFSKITYNLTTSQSGNGTVTASTTYTYDQGLAVVASPDAGWQFDGWTGAGTGNLVDQTVASTTIKNPTTSNTDVVANFSKITYNLTTSQSGNGTVTASTTYTYDQGLAVVASPDAGWQFDGWTGAGTGNLVDQTVASTTIKNPTTSNTDVVANFSKITYNLTTSQSGNGTVTASTTYTYDQGLAVVASPDAGWQFDGWTGAGTGNLVDQTVASTSIKNPTTSNTDVVANFSKITYNLTTSQSGNGTVTASTTYTYDQGLAVVASPDAGWQFDGWTGAGTGNLVDQTVASTSIKNPTTSNTEVVANFSKITYNLTTSQLGIGTVTADTTYVYDQGLAVVASPAVGSIFRRWEGSTSNLVDSSLGTTNIKNPILSDTTLKAIFGHTVTATDDGIATVSPTGVTEVDYGDLAPYTISSNDPAFCVADVMVDGSSQGMIYSYTFNNVTATHTISASSRAVYTVSTSIEPEAARDAGRWRAIDHATGNPFTGWLQHQESANIPCDVTSVRIEYNTVLCWDSPVPSSAFAASSNPTPTGTYSLQSYNLSLGVSGSGTGEVTAVPGGTGVGTYSIDCGTQVILTASLDPGSDFINWLGDVDDPLNYNTTISIYEDETVTAVFDSVQYELSISGSGGGTVSPSAGSHYYDPDTIVTLIATPNANWTFKNWVGDVSDINTQSTKVIMSSDQTVTAIFTSSSNPDTDNDGDGYTESGNGTNPGVDCNDNNAAIHPGATEICGDGLDQDCNGSDATCADDNDFDGFVDTDDCDDNDPTVYPGASEICSDSKIQDCDRVATYCASGDDNFDAACIALADLICDPDLTDADGDGFSPSAGDCDDTDSAIHPGATDICGDGIDQDCYDGDRICDVADTCIEISNTPLNSEVQAPPANIIFLLDDSGSMDFTSLLVGSSGADGIFNGYEYSFDDPGDNTYGTRFPIGRSERRFWESQWSEVSVLWYDPQSEYFPWADNTHSWDPTSYASWPSLPDADPDNPRSNPVHNTQTQTLNFASTADNGGVNSTTYYTTIYEPGGQRITVARDTSSNRTYTVADAVRLVGGNSPTVTQISGGNDDAEEENDGDMSRGSVDLDFGGDTDNMRAAGMRFASVTLPADYSVANPITEARITFTARTNRSGNTNLTFTGHKVANSPEFSGTDDDITDRISGGGSNPTGNTVNWNSVPSWSENNQYNSPNLASIVTEILETGWTEGNPITFIVTGSGSREAISHNADASRAPILTLRTATSTTVNEITIDNTDAEFMWDESWGYRTTGSAYHPTTTNERYFRTSRGEQASDPVNTATWLLNIENAGFYQIFTYNPDLDDSDENALYTIYYDGGTHSGALRVNQRRVANGGNGGQWFELVKSTTLNANESKGDTTITVNDLGEAPRVGAKFTIDGDVQIYTVASGSTATTLKFSPGLTSAYSSGDSLDFTLFWYLTANTSSRDALNIHRAHYYKMSEVISTTTTSSYNGSTSTLNVVGVGTVQAGDLVKLTDRPGAYRLKSDTTSTTLSLKSSIDASSNMIPVGQEVVIVRPYLIVLDSHDIEGNALGADTIQYYRYQDDDWDGVAEFGEDNNMVDYGELTRDLSPPADVIPQKNFIRTTNVAALGASNLDIESTGTAIALGTTFTVEGETLDHTVVSGTTATQLQFTPSLGAAVASGAKVVFNDTTIVFDRNYTEDKQNLANWYQYFSRRELTAKAAVGRVIAEMEDVNIGLHSINNRLKEPVVSVKPTNYFNDASCDATNNYCDETDYLLTKLYASYSSGGTPLRRGLERVGDYFDQTDGSSGGIDNQVSPYLSAAEGGACQQSFVIAMTDGYYNGSDPDLDGDGDNDTGFNADGDGNTGWDGGVYGDNEEDTLSDVAMHYYERDLSTTLDNQVPKNTVDQNSAQHMVMYGVAFGVKGTLPPDPALSCPPDCGWPTNFPFNNQERIDDMFHATVNGRGDFITATSPQSLVDALLAIKSDIEFKTGSGAAVGITPSGQLSTETLVFQGTYEPSNWSGDISAYGLVTLEEYIADQQLTTPTGIKTGQVKYPKAWSAADTMKAIRDNDTAWWHNDGTGSQSYIRQVVSYNGVKGVSFTMPLDPTAPTADELTLGQLGSLGASTVIQQQKINYLRGDVTNEQPNGYAWRGREGEIFGDFIHSAPGLFITTVLSAGDGDGIDNNSDGSIDEVGEEESKLLVGANDGGLHILNADDNGRELLFYIPDLVFDNLDDLSVANPLYQHKYYVDNSVYAKRLGETATDPVLAVGGLGKGGKGYYAINLSEVTNGSSESNAANIVKWEYPNANLLDSSGNSLADTNGYMGYSYSMGYIVRSNASDADWMVVFGNGYESTSGKAVLIVLGLDSNGNIIWRNEFNTGVGNPTPTTPNGTCNGLSSPALIDVNFDGKVDYAYAGDLLGNMWKFDLSSATRGDWGIPFEDSSGVKKPLFTAQGALNRFGSGWESTLQPITTEPDVISACNTTQQGYLVLFGTGRYLKSGEYEDISPQTIYGIWDWSNGFTDPADKKKSYLGSLNLPSEENASLTPPYVRTVSNQSAIPVTRDPARTGSTGLSLLQQTQITGASDPAAAVYRVNSENVMNWYDPITGDGEHVGWFFDLPGNGERMATDLFVRDGILRFVTVQPSDSPCSGGTISIVQGVEACNGGRSDEPYFDINGDGKINSDDLIEIDGEMVPPSGYYSQGMVYSPASVAIAGTGTAVDISSVSDASLKTTITKGERIGIINWREIE
ncbi:PilC/PilY family type IV pilus protein [Desulforhopalus sp. 52FAK]